MEIVKKKRDSKTQELLHDQQVLGDEVSARQSEDKIDTFFVADEVVPPVVEKRAVLRDGRIPMMQKNLEKLQQREIEKQRRHEGWLQEQEAKKEEEARLARAAKPLKIKASSYMNERTVTDKVVVHGSVNAGKLNIKF